ncbi:hypothetical protein SLEP1_g23708 [Rubroshorea leprosula]|uniref:Uncharacterized protein n=1 Tax=Rubroshorea leprosula TaxID=152421 RepID=A0AAV5JJB3_9ROSI|nr:hypothetical protein SLEP1_g23708 [Rubroshorea leprosula]
MNQYNGTGNQRAENGGNIPPNMNSAAAGFGGFAGPVLGVPAYNHVPPRQPSPEPPSAAQTGYILLDVPARRARYGRRGRQHPQTYKYNNPYRRCTNYNCDTDDTPMWRRGPLGPKVLFSFQLS